MNITIEIFHTVHYRGCLENIKMRIKVKIGEKVYQLSVDSDDIKIETLKKQLEEQSNIPSNSQKWVFQGKIINNSLSVKEANLSDESCVIVIKTAIPQNNQLNQNQNSSSISSSQSQPPSISNLPNQQLSVNSFINTQKFDDAMRILLNNSETVVEEAVQLLLKIVSNITKNPSEDKYRKLSNTNATFSKKVGTVNGGTQCMEGIGFILQGSDWILYPSADAWELLVKCKSKLEKFLNKIQNLKKNGDPTSESQTALNKVVPSIATEEGKISVDSSISTTLGSASSSSFEDMKSSTAPKTDLTIDPMSLLAIIQALQQANNSTPANSYEELNLIQNENLKPSSIPLDDKNNDAESKNDTKMEDNGKEGDLK